MQGVTGPMFSSAADVIVPQWSAMSRGCGLREEPPSVQKERGLEGRTSASKCPNPEVTLMTFTQDSLS